MKLKTNIILVILFASFQASYTYAQENAIQGIQNNFEQQTSAWNNGDLKAYVEAYVAGDSAKTISKAGVIYGKVNILKQYQQYYNKENMGTLWFDQFTYQKLREDLYYVVGRFNLKNMDKNKQPKERHGWFSVLMQKIDAKWFILSDHST